MPLPENATNRLVIASAGSGKTQLIVDGAGTSSDGCVVITTFTEANEAEIRRRLVERFGCIPPHVTVQTWYSFLIQHGAKPFQGGIITHEIRGLLLAEARSAQYIPETDTKRHYFTGDGLIYSDKLAKFVLKCDGATGGAVLDRLSRVYQRIYVDEVQDFAGHDLDVLMSLLGTSMIVTLVGDPRQAVYATSKAAKNKGIRGSKLVEFFTNAELRIDVDVDSLAVNHRSVQPICDLSNQLYPDLPQVSSGQSRSTDHDGIFLVGTSDIDSYLRAHRPVQLRYKSNSKGIRDGYSTYNFGLSKGMQFDRALVFPTNDMVKWLSDHSHILADETRAKFYVALTRARFSVGIVTDQDFGGTFPKFIPQQSS
jgi:DNA helicase II / ATP-dependent DNA helicase PcrA